MSPSEGFGKVRKILLSQTQLNPLGLARLSAILALKQKSLKCFSMKSFLQRYWNLLTSTQMVSERHLGFCQVREKIFCLENVLKILETVGAEDLCGMFVGLLKLKKCLLRILQKTASGK